MCNVGVLSESRRRWLHVPASWILWTWPFASYVIYRKFKRHCRPGQQPYCSATTNVLARQWQGNGRSNLSFGQRCCSRMWRELRCSGPGLYIYLLPQILCSSNVHRPGRPSAGMVPHQIARGAGGADSLGQRLRWTGLWYSASQPLGATGGEMVSTGQRECVAKTFCTWLLGPQLGAIRDIKAPSTEPGWSSRYIVHRIA